MAGDDVYSDSSCTICSDSDGCAVVALPADARSFAKMALTIGLECEDDCIHKFIMLLSSEKLKPNLNPHFFFTKPTAYKILRTITTLVVNSNSARQVEFTELKSSQTGIEFMQQLSKAPR